MEQKIDIPDMEFLSAILCPQFRQPPLRKPALRFPPFSLVFESDPAADSIRDAWLVVFIRSPPVASPGTDDETPHLPD